MRISRVKPIFDHGWLDEHCQVFKIVRSAGNFSYYDELFDRLASETKVASVVFGGGRDAWVTLWCIDAAFEAESLVRDYAHDRNDLRYQKLSSSRVDDRVLLRLCLNAVAGDRRLDGASNICGRLVVCKRGKHIEKYARTRKPRVIHALEVGVTPRMELKLSVRTFTSCAVRPFKRSLPRFELVDGLFMRRKLAILDYDAPELFCERVAWSKDRYGGKFHFLDAASENAFDQSKIGVLHMVETIMEETFEGAVTLSYEEVKDVKVIRRSAMDAGKRNRLISSRLSGQRVCVSDATGKLAEEAKKVADIVADSFELETVVAEIPDPQALNIRLIQEAAYYGEGEKDPHDDNGDMVIQHMTPASGFDEVDVEVSVKELAVKLDVREDKVRLFEWAYGDWVFGIRCKENGDSLAFVKVSEDGSLAFFGPLSRLEALDQFPRMTLMFMGDEPWECVVMGPEGDVCAIGRTELYGMPNYKPIACDITTPPEKRKLGRGGKPVQHAIGRTKTDIEFYFADTVDIASCVGADGTSYYRVGRRGPGMEYTDTHTASILRSVVPDEDSKALTEQLLPMFDTELVRWGDPTVLPFPLKYLREWLLMQGCAD